MDINWGNCYHMMMKLFTAMDPEMLIRAGEPMRAMKK